MQCKANEVFSENIDTKIDSEEKISLLISDWMQKKGQALKACVRTYGCQQNVSDSEYIMGQLLALGFELTRKTEEADLIVFNTCAIRENAENRVFGNVGALKRLKEKKPDLLIALCGCMMQQAHMPQQIRNKFPFVDMIFGTDAIGRFPQNLYKTLLEKAGITDLALSDTGLKEGVPVWRENGIQAWLPIMYGCNNFCSYCVVPYVRGRERSRNPLHIVQEAESLIAAGYKEITLLGQNVNSYGKNLEESCSFAGLLKKLSGLPGNFKLRFMTSHPKDATKELFDTMAKNKKICRHLHLPVQAGSNRILKAMNRNYTKEQYLELISYCREVMPGLAISSDIIVGFPGETEDDFNETLELLEQARFSSLYSFLYSRRLKTPAAEMNGQVPKEIKNARFQRLLEIQEKIALEQHAAMEGKNVEILITGESKGGNGRLTGRTEGNQVVDLKGPSSMIGSYTEVRIIKGTPYMLQGELRRD